MDAERRNEGPSTELATQLASHLPALQVRRILERGGPPVNACAHPMRGALLFADISGFTALAERLAPLGPRGAEGLSEILNAFYGRMLEVTDAHGGDVIAFAGDGALVLFPGTSDGALGEAALPAAYCALEIQRALSGFEAGHDTRLTLRVSLGAGALSHYELGGVQDEWLTLVAGEPLDQLVQMNAQARIGAVLVSPEAAAALGSRAKLASVEDTGSWLREVVEPLTLEPIEPRPVPAALATALSGYLPEVITTRLEALQAGFLAEFRRLSVVFISLPDAREDGVGSIERLQPAVATIQQTMRRYQGTVYQCVYDDKGLVVVTAFGLPPRAHEDDAPRACLAAMSIREALGALGRRCAIGIATGRLFCGTYGPSSRRQYSIVGSTINIAARIAQAKSGDSILCEATTRLAAEGRLSFTDSRPLTVKGVAGAIHVSEPRERRAIEETTQIQRVIGRHSERAMLRAWVDRLAAGEPAAPTVVEAEAGMGKSTLGAEACSHARDVGVRVALGRGEELELGSAYYPFRSILKQLLGLAEGAEPAEVEAGLRDRLRGAPELLELTPLLDAVFPTGHLERAPLDHAGQERARRINSLLAGAFRDVARQRPLVLVLEDAHWMDSASWGLAATLALENPEVALLMLSRPAAKENPDYTRFLELPRIQCVQLLAMEDDVLAELLRHHLGVSSLPESFAKRVQDGAEGNPFFAQELALSLREGGFVSLVDGQLKVASESGLREAVLPDTLQGAITGRVDRLPTASQLTLKVASVIGRSFDTEMLAALHPLSDGPALDEELDELEQADMIRPDSATRDSYRFRLSVTQEAVYGLLAYAQRQQLHRSAAAALEARHREDALQPYARLAHHYDRGEMADEAMLALRRAGEQALHGYANREAIRFFMRSLEIDATAEAGLSKLERIQVHRFLNQAHYGLTDYPGTRAACEAALREAGFPVPGGRLAAVAEVMRFAGQAVRHRMTGSRARVLVGAELEQCLYAMQSMGDLLPALLFAGERFTYAQASLQLHNLGAYVEPAPEAASARVGFSQIEAMAGFTRAAERDLLLGAKLCEEAGHELYTLMGWVILGVFYLMQGRNEESHRWLECARQLARQMESGLWRHRALYTLGDALTVLGRYDEAASVLHEGGKVALDAEPSVFGLAVSLRAVTALRLGRAEEAVSLLEEGVATSRDHPTAFALFASLGPLAEAKLRLGDWEAALEAAEETEQIAFSQPEVNSYFPAIHGFAGMCDVYLAGWESSPIAGTPDAAALRRHARRACRAFRRFTRLFPGARPRFQLMEGRRQRLLGNERRAVECWRSAEQLAEQGRTPYELGLARLYLGTASRDRASGARLYRAACQTFLDHGLLHELNRARSCADSPGTLPTPVSLGRPSDPIVPT